MQSKNSAVVPARWTRQRARALAPGAGNAGLTLIELIVAFSLMLILSTMALPVARIKVQREKERRLRIALAEIRTAVDRHKDMADAGLLGDQDPDNHGYPEDLESLVEGVDVAESPGLGAESGLGASTIRESQSLGSRSLSGGAGQSRSRSRSGFGSQRETDRGRMRSSGFGQFQARGIGSPDGLRGGFGGIPGEGLDGSEEEGPEKIRFLRSIPVDPMTGKREWGLLSISDSPLGRSWNGRNVFDVYSLSPGIALDGSTYNNW